MDNAEIERRLAQSEGNDEGPAEAQVATVGYLVFLVEGRHYALPTELVREILIDSPVYFVPFVPPYVRGLINRHGEPYTSFDLSMFMSQQPSEGATHLILNAGNDQVAFLITDVEEILKVPVTDIRELASLQEADSWFSGSFALNGAEVLILDAGSILARLRGEVGRE